MHNSYKATHIPPVWGDLVLGLLATVIFGILHWYCTVNPKFGSYGSIPLWLLSGSLCVILFVCSVFIGGKHYSFDNDNITIRYLGIPVRQIGWRSVSHAIYSQKWRESGKLRYATAVSSIKGNVIFVSLYACPPFDPECDVRPDFAAIHPRTFLCIYLPAKNTQNYLAAFRSHFPCLKE